MMCLEASLNAAGFFVTKNLRCPNLLHTDFREKLEEAVLDLLVRLDMLVMMGVLSPLLQPLEIRFAEASHILGCRIRTNSLDDSVEVVPQSFGRAEAALKKTGEEQDVDATVTAVLLML